MDYPIFSATFLLIWISSIFPKSYRSN